MGFNHHVHIRPDGFTDGFGDFHSQILLGRGQLQIGREVFAVEVVCVCEGIEFESKESSILHGQCLAGVVGGIVAATGEPIVRIKPEPFAERTPEQFIAGNTEHLALQVQQSHVDAADGTKAGARWPDPVEVTVELGPNEIGFHRIQAHDALADMARSRLDDRRARPVGGFAHAGVARVRMDF